MTKLDNKFKFWTATIYGSVVVVVVVALAPIWTTFGVFVIALFSIL